MNTVKRNRKRSWTAAEYAAWVGVNDSRVRQLCIQGMLNGYKRAGSWFIKNDYKAKRYAEERYQRTEGKYGGTIGPDRRD